MPWCPKCKNEYRSGFFECKECGLELVEYLPEELEDKNKREAEVTKRLNSPRDLGAATFLISVRNEQEANLIDSVLRAEGIPTLIKHQDIGSYLTIDIGMSNFGLDIFVPESLLEKGKEVIDGLGMFNRIYQTTNPEKHSVSMSRRQMIGLIIFTLLILPILIGLLFPILSAKL